MSSRVGWSGAMPDSQLRSEARGGVEIIRQVAGKALALFELTAGKPAIDGQRFTPLNPQGEVGVDLSGPPWGSAHRHPIAWWSWLPNDTDVQQPARDPSTSFFSGILIPLVLRCSVWVRPHAPSSGSFIAPYSRGYLWVRGHRASGAVAASLAVRARNLTMGQDFQTEQTASSVTTTASTTAANLFAGTTAYVDLVPGRNDIALTFLCETAACSINLDAVALLQVEKRGH